MIRYACPSCGSYDIHAEAWGSINDSVLLDFVEQTDHYCAGCQEHFHGDWCTVDVATGKCVSCALEDGEGHGEEFKPVIGEAAIEAELIGTAHILLKQARDLLVEAAAPKSAARVRLALSSVRGAMSNANHRARSDRPRKRIRRAPRMEIKTIKHGEQ